MTTRDMQGHVEFQRYCIGTLKPSDNPTHGPEAVNIINPFTGQPMTNAEFFDFHARWLAVFAERYNV